MNVRNIFLMIICLLVMSCNSQTKSGINTVSPAEFAQKLADKPDAQLIDVRTSEEFSGKHLDNATNVDWNGSDFADKVSKLDKSKPVFLYCRSGGRSATAAAKLQQMGFTEIYDMDGGIIKWNTLPTQNTAKQ